MKSKRLLTVAATMFLSAQSLRAGDWPQYRGPSSDGTSAETVTWPAGGPKVLWRAPTPAGFSSFAVAGGKAFTLVTRDANGVPREMCVALDAATGKEAWAADLEQAAYDRGGDSGTSDNKGGDGPRGTPAVSGNLVYATTANLALFALDAGSGKVAWKKDLVKEHGGKNIMWRNAAAPIVEGDLVIVGGGGAGQSIVAFNKVSGAVVWKAFDEKITHATPAVATILGQRQVIFFTQKGLVAIAPADGKLLWRFSYPFSTSSAASPVVSGDIVYCSAGYGVGGGACRISKEGDAFKATKLWQIQGDAKVANHWSTPVVKDGHLYGMFSFKKYGSGPMKCVDIATGEIKWEQPGFGAGNVILAGDKLVALADTGELVVVSADPAGYKEVGRAKAVTGKCWSTPALADGKVYVRSTKEGACLDLGGK